MCEIKIFNLFLLNFKMENESNVHINARIIQIDKPIYV